MKFQKLPKKNHLLGISVFSAKGHADVILRAVFKSSPFTVKCLLCVGYFKGLQCVYSVSDLTRHWQRRRWACLMTVVKVWLSNQSYQAQTTKICPTVTLVQCFINTLFGVFYYFLKLTLVLGFVMKSGSNFLKRYQLAPLFGVCGKIHMPGTGEGTKLLQSQAKIRVRKGEGQGECKVPWASSSRITLWPELIFTIKIQARENLVFNKLAIVPQHTCWMS